MRRKVLLYILLFSIIISCGGVVFAADGTGTQVEVNRIIGTTISILIGYCLVSSLYLIVELIVIQLGKEDNFLCKLLNTLIAMGGIPFFFVPLILIMVVKLSSSNKKTKIIVNVSLACFLLLAAFMLYILAFSGRARNIEVKPE